MTEPQNEAPRVAAPEMTARFSDPAGMRPAYRITVFVPPTHVEEVLDAVEREIDLVYGQYDRSAWWSAPGVEQFRPLPGSRPTVGVSGRLEQVPTVRLEFAVPHDAQLLQRVIRFGVLASHPWQEPAVFVDETLVTATRMAEMTMTPTPVPHPWR